jgi:hypothetical protein
MIGVTLNRAPISKARYFFVVRTSSPPTLGGFVVCSGPVESISSLAGFVDDPDPE